jgi:hypothetical protein
MTDEALLAPVKAPRSAAWPAEQLISERVFLFADAHGLKPPVGLDDRYGGLAVCGDRADPFQKIAALRDDGHPGPLLGDPARYTKNTATAEAPFVHGDGDLFGDGLESALDEQIGHGATLALTPTGYLNAGDGPALRAVVAAAERLERADTIVMIPAEVGWLRTTHVGLLTEALADIPHPVALALGGQLNPLDRHKDATRNLRQLLVTVPGVGLWRTDFAAIDAIAHGAPFAAIGARTGLRHIIPPGEKAQSARNGGGVPPSVLLPRLLHFTTGPAIATRYANDVPPVCGCRVCDYQPLTRFDGNDGAIHAEANAHNAAAWNGLLPTLFGEPGLGERQAFWKRICVDAVNAHDLENKRLQQPRAFTVPRDVERYATYTVTHALLPVTAARP